MADPFAKIKPIDAAGLTLIDDPEAFGALRVPFDDAPTFDDGIDSEVDVNARLVDDRSHFRTAGKRLFVDYRSNPDAFRHLARLPRERESLHGVICGRYAMWDLVPAILERTAGRIDDLIIATLSYSKTNAVELLELLDVGRIRRVSLLVSYYFKAQNRALYDSLVPALRERGHRVLAMRTHAKILLVKVARGGSYVCEGSANLRSCKNVEQFVLTRDRRLYRFHRDWISGELLTGVEEGEPAHA